MTDELHSLRGLARLLGIPKHQLQQLAARPDFHYDPFTVRRGKKERDIDNPLAWLKGVQRAIRRRILMNHQVSESARACVKGGSPLKHAKALTGHRSLAEADLKNCYPSMSSETAYKLYRSLGFGVRNASILTKLTTWQGHLPQGAPTSDMLANLILRAVDERAKEIADAHGLVYSRCMDGFVIAGHDTRAALGLIITEILKERLPVRASKIWNQTRGKAQIVAGYNVNTPYGPKVRTDKVKEIRSDVCELIRARERGEDITAELRSVKGSLAYLLKTNQGDVRRLERQLLNAGIEIKPKAGRRRRGRKDTGPPRGASPEVHRSHQRSREGEKDRRVAEVAATFFAESRHRSSGDHRQ